MYIICIHFKKILTNISLCKCIYYCTIWHFDILNNNYICYHPITIILMWSPVAFMFAQIEKLDLILFERSNFSLHSSVVDCRAG